MKRVFPRCRFFLLPAIFFFCAFLPAAGQGGSSVWTIGKNGNTMFLGGSIHTLREDDFPLPKEFDRAFDRSSTLILEADLEKAVDPDFVQHLISEMYLPEGVTLASILDSQTYEMLRAQCEKFGFPMESVAQLKPSMIITILSVLEMQNSGFVQQGVDAHYLEKAKETGKTLGFLETVEEQIHMIVTMGDGYENDFVRYSLYGMDNTENELDAIVSGWRTGDAADTKTTLTEMQERWPILYQNLLVDRNEAWLPQLEEHLAGGTVVFVIVGLAHLHGPDGLLQRLEDSGCTVKQFR